MAVPLPNASPTQNPCLITACRGRADIIPTWPRPPHPLEDAVPIAVMAASSVPTDPALVDTWEAFADRRSQITPGAKESPERMRAIIGPHLRAGERMQAVTAFVLDAQAAALHIRRHSSAGPERSVSTQTSTAVRHSTRSALSTTQNTKPAYGVPVWRDGRPTPLRRPAPTQGASTPPRSTPFTKVSLGCFARAGPMTCFQETERQ